MARTTVNTVHSQAAVLIPFYGRREALQMTLASLEEEPFPHDVIIVDDGNGVPLGGCECGTGSVAILRHDSNLGITAALNTGLHFAIHAGYRYIARLDAGDRHIPGRLERQVRFLNEHPECGFVGGQARFVGCNGQYLFTTSFSCTPPATYRELHRHCCFVHPTVMFRAEVIQQVGGYRDKYPAAEDYDLFFRIAERFPTANLPEVLLDYEVAPRSISTRRRRRQVFSKLRIVLEHFRLDTKESFYGVGAAVLALLMPRRAVIEAYRMLQWLRLGRMAKKREIAL